MLAAVKTKPPSRVFQDALLLRRWSINSHTISGDEHVQVVSNNGVNLQSGKVLVVGKKPELRCLCRLRISVTC
nr:hypothetical protein [Tanacetum cinerariifolium]